MADSKELRAMTAAITKEGLFFCKSCWIYRSLLNAKQTKRGKVCVACVAKIAAAKAKMKGGLKP